MTERILGETGSRRRRRLLVLPVLVVACTALFVISGAQAVHLDGFFELDNNAISETDVPDTTSDGVDWDQVYAAVQANADTKCDAASGVEALGAIECAWTHDDPGTSIFTQGGSKDDLDISSWQHTSGSVPDKDEISDAYAAMFENAGGDQILYFGANRDANNGAADFGFWFLQSETQAGPAGTFIDANGDPAVHTVGDILLLGTFTQGGVAVNIRAFVWDPANATINGVLTDPGITLADCDLASATDSGCGTVNAPAPDPGIASPWPYTAKFADPSTVNPHKNQSKSNIFPSGSFFEGGINLSDFDLEGCFSSFLVETRSSPEIGAQLKDFVISNFESCESSLTTTTTLDSITLGGSVSDSATVTGSGPGAPAPTGDVTFFVCGPTDAGSTALCETGGTPVPNTDPPTPVALDGTSNPSTVQSAAVTPTAVGRYCFRAEYSGDANYDPVVHFGSITTDDPNGTECFVVSTIPTTTTTAQRWTPNDSANIATAGPVGYNLTGSVTFTLYGPGDAGCVGTKRYEETINIPAAAGLTETVSTTNGDGVGIGLAADFTVADANEGTYSWKVVYTPAASDTAHTGSQSACHNEHSDVTIENDDPAIPNG